MPHVQNPATPKGWFHFLMISGPISSGICGPTTFYAALVEISWYPQVNLAGMKGCTKGDRVTSCTLIFYFTIPIPDGVQR